MKFSTEAGKQISNPSRSDLLGALNLLGDKGNSFAILETSPQRYIQAAGSKSAGFTIEYREGSEQSHHHSLSNNLTHQQTVDIMLAYYSGVPWKSMVAWEADFSDKRASLLESGFRFFFVMAFLLVGLVSLAVGILWGHSSYLHLREAVSTKGSVVQLVRQGSTYVPLVEYTDQAGNLRRFQSELGSEPPSFSVGEQVMVFYNPTTAGNPNNARIGSFGELWGPALLASLVGIVFCGMAIHSWVSFAQKGDDPPGQS